VEIFISELTKVEFPSAVWKKCRTKELSEEDARLTIEDFISDLPKFSIISLESAVIDKAVELLAKYGNAGLRSLDAIQLSCALVVQKEISAGKTADVHLRKFFELEGIAT